MSFLGLDFMLRGKLESGEKLRIESYIGGLIERIFCLVQELPDFIWMLTGLSRIKVKLLDY